jgi:DNA polymerase delta subunit 1
MKQKYHTGLLTNILEDLLSQRKIAKNDMKNTNDPMKKMVFDGRQKALKTSANSVYGFTGAQMGMLPCLDISASVTGIGQEMIILTQQTVEKHYCKANGYLHDAKVIYGDTDSVMVNFGVSTIKEAMDLGLEAANMISKLFKPPIKLEFEKVFARYLLLAKKRYCGLKFELGDNLNGKGKLTSAGLETKRRDNCQLIRTMLSNILKMAIQDGKIQESVEYTKNVIRDLLSNNIDINMLIITKSISKPIKSYNGKVSHVELAKRMIERDPATAPKTGDRISYVIVKAGKNAKTYEKVEDPIYVLENGLQLDYRHYLDNQIMKPLMRIYRYLIDSPEKLMCGEHTRFISNQIPTKKIGILKFVKIIPTCLQCRCSLDIDEIPRNVCKSCEPDMVNIYTKALNEKNYVETLHSRVWTHCQRCQGSLLQEVICNNNDCSLFYVRMKTQIDLQQLNEKMNKFNLW